MVENRMKASAFPVGPVAPWLWQAGVNGASEQMLEPLVAQLSRGVCVYDSFALFDSLQ